MRSAVTAVLIQTKFCKLTPWVDLVIYLKPYPNWFRGFEGVTVRIILTSPIDFGTDF